MNAYLADLTCRLCSATLLLLSLSACIGTSVGNPSSDQENSGGDEATGGDDREQDAGQSTDTSVGEADAYEPDDDTGAAGEDSIDSPRFCASETECDTGERCVDEICRLSCDVESSEVDGGDDFPEATQGESQGRAASLITLDSQQQQSHESVLMISPSYMNLRSRSSKMSKRSTTAEISKNPGTSTTVFPLRVLMEKH